MENIFKTVKKQYLSDAEFVFDFASELLDKLHEKYPNAKLEGVQFTRGIDMLFMMNEDAEIRITYVPAMYSTSAPGLRISFEALGPREQTYSVYTKGTPISRPESVYIITTIMMDRYNKVIDIFDKNEKYPAFESEAYELINLVKEIDSKLDKGGKEFETITSTDRKDFDDYLD